MNIIINQSKFAQAVRIVERIVGKSNSLPVLGTILLRVEKGQLQLSATNLEVGIRAWVGVKVESDGAIAVPARILSEFVGSITDEKIVLTAEKNILTIKSEHAKTNILGMKAEEFPIIPNVVGGVGFDIPAATLSELLSGVIDAASTAESRPELSGVYMHCDGKKLICAATDSFRLSEKITAIHGELGKQFILPRVTAQEILRLASSTDQDIKITTTETQLACTGEGFELVSRLVDGHYPEYRRVIPEKSTASASVSRVELEQNIRMASVFSSSISDLMITAEKDALQITAKNSDRGDFASRCDAKLTGAPFSVTVNYRYLLDGLKTLSSNRVIVGFSGVGSPLTLRGEGVDGQVYVIMPLRTP